MTENSSSTGTSAPNRSSSNLSVVLLLVVSLFVLGIAVVILWITTVRMPQQQHEELAEQMQLQSVGLNESRRSKLSDAFTDGDGDLIADPPKDAKKLVDPATLVFSYVATEDQEPWKTAWKDFEDYLGKATGKKVEFLPVTSPEDQLRALRDGKLHVTGFATGLVPAAVNQGGFVPVCTLGNEQGKSTYEVEIIVRPDSSIQSPSDLHGKDLTLTEIGSNSGYKAPIVLLKQKFNLLPFKDYLVRYSGGHDQSIRAIAKGECEAAAVANDVLQRDVASGELKKDQFRSVFKSDPFPRAALGYVYNLKPELAAKVKQALLDFPWKGTSVETRFAGTGDTKFVPVNYKDDWTSVRAIDDAVGYVYEIK